MIKFYAAGLARLEGANYEMICLGVADGLRLAQQLKYHRLGGKEDSNTMPTAVDIGLPHGNCAIRRQLAIRLWSHLEFLDALTGVTSGLLLMSSDQTQTVINCHDSDLTTSIEVIERPLTEWTSATPTLAFNYVGKFKEGSMN